MPRNISVMSVRLAPSVKTVMIADYIVLRTALSPTSPSRVSTTFQQLVVTSNAGQGLLPWPEPPMYNQFLCLLHSIPGGGVFITSEFSLTTRPSSRPLRRFYTATFFLQLPIHLAEKERDLWSLFALALTAKSRVEIVKTKAHTEWAKSSDAQFEGFYNDLAESAAKTVIATFAGCFPKYDEMCRGYLKQLSFAKHMAKFHARIGEFASLKPTVNNVESEVAVVGNVIGHPFFAAPTCDDDELPHDLSRSFLIVLRNWIVDLV